LDIGTNNAVLPILIKKKYSSLKVTGSDIYLLEYWKLLAKLEKCNINFITLNILNLNGKVEKYDTVIFSHVLEHFPEKMNKKIINNLLKLTKKRLIIVVPIENRNEYKEHLQIFNIKKIKKLKIKAQNKKIYKIPRNIMFIIDKN